MMSLSSTTGHAIQALACLASCSSPPANIKDVATCANVPQAYLAKIFKKLNDCGIVESKRGTGGGIWLARPAKLISLLEICVALEGEEFLDCCLLGPERCSDERECPTHRFWSKNKELMRRELERTKLSDVLEFYRQKGSHQMNCGQHAKPVNA